MDTNKPITPPRRPFAGDSKKNGRVPHPYGNNKELPRCIQIDEGDDKHIRRVTLRRRPACRLMAREARAYHGQSITKDLITLLSMNPESVTSIIRLRNNPPVPRPVTPQMRYSHQPSRAYGSLLASISARIAKRCAVATKLWAKNVRAITLPTVHSRTSSSEAVTGHDEVVKKKRTKRVYQALSRKRSLKATRQSSFDFLEEDPFQSLPRIPPLDLGQSNLEVIDTVQVLDGNAARIKHSSLQSSNSRRAGQSPLSEKAADEMGFSTKSWDISVLPLSGSEAHAHAHALEQNKPKFSARGIYNKVRFTTNDLISKISPKPALGSSSSRKRTHSHSHQPDFKRKTESIDFMGYDFPLPPNSDQPYYSSKSFPANESFLELRASFDQFGLERDSTTGFTVPRRSDFKRRTRSEQVARTV